ncbi:MAG: tetratricopeptide repeat protein [Magnetococcales bacterium]|nr:tetratricopeptide repeat protein [Magnetococcales bacterium]
MKSLVAVCLCFALLTGLSFPEKSYADELEEIYRLADQRRFDQANRRLNAYLKENPKDPQARFLKGLVLTEQKKRGEAIKVFTALSRDYPELPEPFNNLAVLFAEQGDYDKARDALTRAIETHPNYATAHENLGDIYAKMASQSYSRALQLNRSNAQAQAKLNLVTKLFTMMPGQEGESAVPASTAQAAPVKKSYTPPPPAPRRETTQAAAKPKAAKAKKDSSAAKRASVEKAVRAWASAWSARDVNRYLSHYGSNFELPDDVADRSAWEQKRRWIIRKARSIKVELRNLKVTLDNDSEARVTFQQIYRSSRYKDKVAKTLFMEKERGRWRIVREVSGS